MMRKLLLIFLFLIISIPAVAKDEQQQKSVKKTQIEDELLKHLTVPQNQQTTVPKEEIYDELIESRREYIETEAVDNELFQATGNVIKMTITKQGYHKYEDIGDELISDEYIDNSQKVRKIHHKKHYDFTKQSVPIKIKIATNFNHKNRHLEGDTIPFIATHDFTIDGRTYPKGTIIFGRIETLSASDKMGVPETLKIDNFYIDEEGDVDINLHGSISKTGANRSIWVYPLYQAGNIMFYVAGFVFVPIHGGHAKLSSEEVHTIFYETPSDNENRHKNKNNSKCKDM